MPHPRCRPIGALLLLLTVLLLTVSLCSANDDPAPGFHVQKNKATTLDVQHNDASPGGLAIVSQPTGGAGTVSVDASGTQVLFEPAEDYTGQCTFTYSNNGGTFTTTAFVGYRYLIPPRVGILELQARNSFLVVSPFAQTPLAPIEGVVYLNGMTPPIPVVVADPLGPSVEIDLDALALTPLPLMTTTLNTVESNRGIIVDLDNEATITISQRWEFHQSSLTAKGEDGRGTEFYAVQMYGDRPYIFHYPDDNVDASNFISVIASVPDTTVTINLPQYSHVGPPSPGEQLAQQVYVAGTTVRWRGQPTGSALVCFLENIGDTCSVLAEQVPGDTKPSADISGAIITADKPISVATGTTDTFITSGCGDNGWDQLVPIDYLGQYYVLVRGNALYNEDIDGDPDTPETVLRDLESAYVIATEDNTRIWFDNDNYLNPPRATLDRGQVFLIRPVGTNVGDVLYIRASKKVAVAQSSSNNICETGVSIIPPYLLTEAHAARFKTPLLTNDAGSSVTIVTTTNAIQTGGLSVQCLSCPGGPIEVDWTATNPNSVVVEQIPGREGLSTVRIAGNVPGDVEEPTLEILGNHEYLVVSTGLSQVGVLFGTGPGGGYGYVTDYSPAALDIDKDGIPDVFDIDVDNDGIRDDLEFQQSSLGYYLPAPFGDEDFDGTPNFQDPDVANCNFQLGECTGYDTDGDGIPNHYDLDSDNDGVSDLSEGGTDPGIYDLDNDWQIDVIPGRFDENDNGLADGLETFPESGVPIINPALDTDGDGIINILDVDSDNDGFCDMFESRTYYPFLASYDPDGTGLMNIITPVDMDQDGIDALYDGDDTVRGQFTFEAPRDHDGDGVPDFLDLDSDNDAILDIVETRTPLIAFDMDRDGYIDHGGVGLDGYIDQGGVIADIDLDGIPDNVDSDTTRKGGASGMYSLTAPNRDAAAEDDNWPDYIDLDADQDGLSDLFESGYFTISELYARRDTNEDGVVDGVDVDGDGILSEADQDDMTFGSLMHPVPENTDLDQWEDYVDWDSDNDGDPDMRDIGERDLVIWDTNNDFMLDGGPPVAELDGDEDGIYDAIDMLPGAYGGIFLPRRFEIMEPLQGDIWWMYRTGHIVFRSNLLSDQYTHVYLRLYSEQTSAPEDDLSCPSLLTDIGNIPLRNDFVPVRIEWIQNGVPGAHGCWTGPAYLTAAPNGPLGEDEEFRVSETFFIEVRANNDGPG
eukprot:TRINITY_DN311_c0_g1_i2.p1 TRINITY_DN311_c0_g1~~TRINITY_DN311_c0_g1_i2.p1  ORF type:complete len:1262 (+),score=299.16 TRINITY_DN311_c0_g1_i2:163-3786(+)